MTGIFNNGHCTSLRPVHDLPLLTSVNYNKVSGNGRAVWEERNVTCLKTKCRGKYLDMKMKSVASRVCCMVNFAFIFLNG